VVEFIIGNDYKETLKYSLGFLGFLNGSLLSSRRKGKWISGPRRLNGCENNLKLQIKDLIKLLFTK